MAIYISFIKLQSCFDRILSLPKAKECPNKPVIYFGCRQNNRTVVLFGGLNLILHNLFFPGFSKEELTSLQSIRGRPHISQTQLSPVQLFLTDLDQFLYHWAVTEVMSSMLRNTAAHFLPPPFFLRVGFSRLAKGEKCLFRIKS